MSTAIERDLRANLSRFLESGSLSREEAHLTLLAAATTVQDAELAEHAARQLRSFGLNDDEIREARESAAFVGMLNVYYRFRHFLGSPEEYRVASLRMTAIARPVLGKERFEMLAFAISVLNGCETCTRAHEKALRKAGVSTEKIHDLVRIAAITQGLKLLPRENAK